ncbi:MAG: hypothetical protein KBE23_04920 [Chloroflexi bacterium]|nr:hypothetical protein [Chloroflexota bacterium]MBP7042061.1 hypothetical protein [Chloroflexota bacterium]
MKKRPYIFSGLIGLAVIVMSLVTMTVFPQESPGQIEGIGSPIIAFEFAETPEEIYTLLGANGTPEQAAMAAAMDQGNRIDYLYMLLYSGFLFTFAMTAVRQTKQRWLYVTAVLALLAFVGDALENMQLFGITAGLASGDFAVELARLHWLTWLKWGSLATYFVLIGVGLWRGNGRFAKFITITAVVTFLLGLVSFIQRGPATEPFTLAIALMFVLLIGFSFVPRRKEAEIAHG